MAALSYMRPHVLLLTDTNRDSARDYTYRYTYTHTDTDTDTAGKRAGLCLLD